ncbi:helix-turn-helix domain-containing protein [Microbacterium oxydans]|uniref:helix-turn-helix domain-containing protein n=1 Tax=Microbacterium oxydans TaxID=82380 RepID=UPI0037CC3738
MFRSRPPIPKEARVDAPEDIGTGSERGDEEGPDDEDFGPWGHGRHRHDDDQFIVALSGSAVIEVDGEPFTVDQTEGIWIPAGVPHSARFHPGFAPFVHRTGAPTGVVSAPCAVAVSVELRNRLLATAISGADASPLLCAALRRSSRRRSVRGVGDPAHVDAVAVSPVGAPAPRRSDAAAERARMRSEVARIAHAELRGPLTSAIGAALRADPADDRTLDGWARRLHTSTTSIRRAFVTELGTSYTTWRTAVRLEAAAALLRRGYPVANAARAVGLTHNGLLAAFHRGYGCRPSAMRRHQTRDMKPSGAGGAPRSR